MGVDPGPCPICDAPHCACTTDRGPITVAQLPMRDAAAVSAAPGVPPSPAPSTAADPALPVSSALGDGSDDRPFSTATYRGKKKRR